MKDKLNSLLHRSREQKSIPLHGDTGISEREIGLPGATPKRVRGGVGISIDADILIKSAVVGALLILFALLQTTLFLFLVWDSETKPWVLLVFIPLLGWRCFWASRPHIRSLGCCFVGWVSCTLSD